MGSIIRFPRPEPRPDLEERRVENLLRPKTGNVRVEPRDSPELQKAQAFLWSLHLLDNAFKGEQ